MNCETCLTVDEHIEATHFCKTCHNPDPMCGTCAKHHIRQKPYKDHEICADIDQIPNKEHTDWYYVEFSCTNIFSNVYIFLYNVVPFKKHSFFILK